MLTSLHRDPLFLRGRGVHVTQLDLIKTLAVVLMIIDHIGAFFYPDHMMWRAIGRIGLPVWFFLGGYHYPRHIINRPLLLGGTILAVAYMVGLQRLYPLNALFSLYMVGLQTLAFLAIRPWWDRQTLTGRALCLMVYAALLIALFKPAAVYWEYGTIGLLLGLGGMLMRDPAGFSPRTARMLWLMIGATVILLESLIFPIRGMALMVMTLGMTAMIVTLMMAPARTYPFQSIWLRLFGRYTLEIYVIHLIIFIALRAMF